MAADEFGRRETGVELRLPPGTIVARLSFVRPAAPAVAIRRPVVIGREAGCDLVLDDPEVSRRHARVTPRERQLVLEDLESANGTFVNGERIVGSRALAAGDRLELGNVELEVVATYLAPTLVRTAPRLTQLREIVREPGRLLTAETGKRKWWTLLVVAIGTFMLLLDVTIVSVAIPSISSSLGASFAQVQWVIDAYALMLAAVLLTAGSISDRIGRRTVFVTGLGVFTGASAVCGLAPSAVALDLSRGVQGIGGAMMLSTSLALLAQEFPPVERRVAFAIWGAVGGAAGAVGPLAGGVLTQALGWQAIFYVNLPIGAIACYLALTKLVNLAGTPSPIDWGGFVTFSVAMMTLLFAVIRGNDEGWTSPLILGLLSMSLVVLVAFVALERRIGAPMFDISLFRKPTFDGAAIVTFALGASLLALVIYIALWLQSVLGYSALQSGLQLLAMMIPILAFAPVSSRLSGKVPEQLLLGIGLALIAGGDLWMSRVDAGSRWTVLLPGLVTAGAGMGITATPLAALAVGVVPPWRSGMASGISTTFRQMGTAGGIAVLGAIFQSAVRDHVSSGLAHTTEAPKAKALANAIISGSTQQVTPKVPLAHRAAFSRLAAASFSGGLADIFVVAAAVAIVGALAALLLVRRRDLIAPAGEGSPAAVAGA